MLEYKKIMYIGIPIVSFIAGIIARQLFIKKPKKEEILGTLRIDNSDKDNPNSLFLELNVPIDYISTKKSVEFNVLKENYIRK